MNKQDEIKLRQAWVNQLLGEHEYTCRSRKVHLKNPLIEISDSQSYWGKWNARERTLKISSHLILNYSWDIVLAVLQHEMAHQVVTDIFGSDEKHGDYFKKACEIIGVPEDFISAGGDLPRKLRDIADYEAHSETRANFEKVRKLLSLAQSTNEHEAALAMQKANELIEKYNIDRLKREEESEYVHRIIELKRKRIENYHKRICSILMDFFFVEVVLSYQYDAQIDDTHRVIDILGAVENVLIAEYVYYFLMNQLDCLWMEYRQKTGLPGKKKRSYWLGILKGFWEQLESQEKKRRKTKTFTRGVSPLTSSLVLAQDQGLSRFKNKRYPRLSHRSESTVRIDSGAFLAGIKDGEKLTLHQGLTRQNGPLGKFISEK